VPDRQLIDLLCQIKSVHETPVMTCWKYRRWVATWVFGKRRSCTLEIHQKRRCDVL